MTKTSDRNPVRYSFRRRLNSILYAFIALEIALTILLSFYNAWALRRTSFQNLRQVLNIYNTQLSEDLRGVDYFLMEMANNNAAISNIAAARSGNVSYNEVVRTDQTFELTLRSFPKISGLYAYFPRNDTWICRGSTSSTRQDFQLALREIITQEEYLKSQLPVNGLKWQVYTHENATYFVKVFQNDAIVIGAWTDADRLSASLTDIQDMDAAVLFIDQEGIPQGSPSTLARLLPEELDDLAGTDALRLSLDDDPQKYKVLRLNNRRYLALSAPLSFCEDRIAALVPLTTVDQIFRPALRLLLPVVLLTLVLFLAAGQILTHFTRNTLKVMEDATAAIMAGDIERRIDTDAQRCEEVLHLSEAYNRMVDQIQGLKIDVYEKDLESKNYQLQYLRSQVAPHFLINCLNMMSYLADGKPENGRIIRQMVTTLSGHLRYTLSTREQVSLKQELEYLRNYVELTKLRFPGCVTYEEDVEEAAGEAMVFPLIFIMFTENTFKYNLVMGEPLTVKVSARVEERDGERRLILTHIDSGSGYTQEILEQYNSGADTITLTDGTHVGIRNVDRRLKLYYGESAHLTLGNEPGMGARNDIDIPFVPYREA